MSSRLAHAHGATAAQGHGPLDSGPHHMLEYLRPQLGQHNRQLLTYLLTFLLTPWSRVLLEKLIGLQLVKKFPAFYGTRRFIIAFKSSRHLSLS